MTNTALFVTFEDPYGRAIVINRDMVVSASECSRHSTYQEGEYSQLEIINGSLIAVKGNLKTVTDMLNCAS